MGFGFGELTNSCFLGGFVSPGVWLSGNEAVLSPPAAYRWYFRSSSDCQGCFLSGNLSGILIFRKSWIHFSSSSSMESFSFTAFFLLELDSREPEVRVRSRSLFLRISDCCSSCTGPFLAGLSRVWMLCCRVTGPQMTVSCGELASDWLSQLDVDSSLQDVPLSPSLSPLPFLQQQSQWDEDQREGSPAEGQRARGYCSSRAPHAPVRAGEPQHGLAGQPGPQEPRRDLPWTPAQTASRVRAPRGPRAAGSISPGAPPSSPPCADQCPARAGTSPEILKEKPPRGSLTEQPRLEPPGTSRAPFLSEAAQQSQLLQPALPASVRAGITPQHPFPSQTPILPPSEPAHTQTRALGTPGPSSA